MTVDAPVGSVGVIALPTRGPQGAGEVLVRIRGGTECFLAWADEPLAKGTTVLVISRHGPRAVDVVPWLDPDALGGNPANEKE